MIGFGKTYISITAAIVYMLQHPDTDTIILCPQCAVKAFKRELTEKVKVSFNLLTSAKPIIQPGARIHVITHSALKKYLNFIDELHNAGRKLILMIDEAQILQDSNNQFYQMLAPKRPFFSIVWELTATPLGNSLTGLYWLLYFLNPKIVGSLAQFKANYFIIKINKIKRWVGKYPNKRQVTFNEEVIVGYKNLDKLSEILKNYVKIKQKKYNLVWHYHKFDLTEAEMIQYLTAGQGLKRETSEKNFAVRLHDLQMVVDNLEIPIDKTVLKYKLKEKLKKENNGVIDEEKLKYLYKTILSKSSENRKANIMESELSSKELAYIQVIKEELVKGRPVLTYLDYADVVDRLEKILREYSYELGVKQVLKVTGGISLKERELVEESIEAGTVVLITSAGTESINLQKSNSIIFYDTPFSVLTFIQAVGRITRMDSKYNEQHVHIMEATGTIDSYKRLCIMMNANLIEAIFGGIETLPTEMLKIDKGFQGELRKQLLWCFDSDKLLTEQEMKDMINAEIEKRGKKDYRI